MTVINPIPTVPRTGLRVSSRGAVRRLQALHHCGYDVESLVPVLSWSDTIIDQLLTSPPQTILASSHERVTKIFKQLRDIPATGDPARIAAAKRRADDSGWAGPFDWDDLDTDIRPVHARRQTHTGVVLEEETPEIEPAQVLPVEPSESEVPVDVHESMTESQMRSHYARGCRAQCCKDATTKAKRDLREARKAAAKTSGGEQGRSPSAYESTPTSSRVGGKSGDAVPEPSPVVPSAPTPPEPAPAKTGVTETTREQYLEQQIRSLEGELSDVFAGRDRLLELLAALRTEFAAQTALLEQMVQLNETLTAAAAAEQQAVDPRDEQLILLVSEVAELERARADLNAELTQARQVIADELDLRSTLLAQLELLEKEPATSHRPLVTVSVHVGGVRVA